MEEALERLPPRRRPLGIGPSPAPVVATASASGRRLERGPTVSAVLPERPPSSLRAPPVSPLRASRAPPTGPDPDAHHGRPEGQWVFESRR
eukprot:2661309-Alexandrium_andersonii.AAC.1